MLRTSHKSAGSRHAPPWDTPLAGGQESMRAIFSPGWRVSCASPRLYGRARFQRIHAENCSVADSCFHAIVIVFSSVSHGIAFWLFQPGGFFCFSAHRKRPGRPRQDKGSLPEKPYSSGELLKCEGETHASEAELVRRRLRHSGKWSNHGSCCRWIAIFRQPCQHGSVRRLF